VTKIKCAVLGGTGSVGQRFVKMLEGHPFFDLSLIVASKKNIGKRYGNVVHWLIEGDAPLDAQQLKIEGFNLDVFNEMGIKIVFSALPPDIAKEYEKRLAEEGYAVFSNSRAYRFDEKVPILVPEVNPDHIKLVDLQRKKRSGYIVTNPNCSTSGLVIALRPLMKYNLSKVVVSTYQALSGAGYPGVPSVDINSNVIPYIRDEEEKIEDETKKILGVFQNNRVVKKDIVIVSSCVRVPVRDGHLESVVVEFEDEVDLEYIKQAMRMLPSIKNLPTSPVKPIILRNEVDRPQPLLDLYAGEPKRAEGMSITVGRFKRQQKQVRFFLLVHNTVRGGAGNSILNAEYAMQKGYL